ncbi:hypothetical protein AX16_007774 [Volvariella volvacea WC 439]|nr:hypothetical protein AX16_007774 [Volvariella volvacea WC 439]
MPAPSPTLLPTSHLPPIRTISSQSLYTLTSAVKYLRKIYNPEIRGTHRLRRRRSKLVGKTGDPELAKNDIKGTELSVSKDVIKSETNSDLTSYRSDDFERAYAIRWLTALVAHLTTQQEDIETEHNAAAENSALVEEAASLLAVCSGPAGAGVLTRELYIPISRDNELLSGRHDRSDYGDESRDNEHRKGTPDPDPITIRLRDVPLDNSDYGSVGAQTWGGAYVLSELIVEDPIRFGFGGSWFRGQSAEGAQFSLCSESSKHTGQTSSVAAALPVSARRSDFRILELGAGTGLVSIAIGRLLERFQQTHQIPTEAEERGTRRSGIPDRFTIVATDYYPTVLENLTSNIQANFAFQDLPGVKIMSHPLDWSLFPNTSKTDKPDEPLGSPFDLVFGADIIYEAQHAIWIKGCLESLLRKPLPPRTEPNLTLPCGTERFNEAHPGPRTKAVDSMSISGGDDGFLEGNPVAFHLVIPLRSTHSAESSSVEQVFPFHHSHRPPRQETLSQGAILSHASLHSRSDENLSNISVPIAEAQPTASQEPELVILEKDILVCDAEEGSNGHRPVEEVEYAYYKIGWGFRS